jgi:hypothetical protein
LPVLSQPHSTALPSPKRYDKRYEAEDPGRTSEKTQNANFALSAFCEVRSEPLRTATLVLILPAALTHEPVVVFLGAEFHEMNVEQLSERLDVLTDEQVRWRLRDNERPNQNRKTLNSRCPYAEGECNEFIADSSLHVTVGGVRSTGRKKGL